MSGEFRVRAARTAIALACSLSAASCTPPASTAPEREVPAAATESGAAPTRCQPQPFAEAVDLAEASGAVYVPGAVPFLLAVGDSGTSGAYAELDAESGTLLGRGRLPLDEGASDDLEGLARIGTVFYALTSSGRVRHYERTAEGYRQLRPAYPIGSGKHVCRDPLAINCGPNYEGLCLDPAAAPGPECAGFAASKADGHLYCLVLGKEGLLALDPQRRIQVAREGTLSGCAIGEDGSLFVGNNLLAANEVAKIANWRQFPAKKQSLGPLGVGFQEAIASASGGLLFRFSDTARSPSLLSKYRCQ